MSCGIRRASPLQRWASLEQQGGGTDLRPGACPRSLTAPGAASSWVAGSRSTRPSSRSTPTRGARRAAGREPRLPCLIPVAREERAILQRLRAHARTPLTITPQIGFPIKIGRGVYSVKYDRARDHVYATSGIAGNLAVIKASPGAPYNVREAVFTKAGARTLAFDPASGAVYTAAPDGRFNPSAPVNEDLAGAWFGGGSRWRCDFCSVPGRSCVCCLLLVESPAAEDSISRAQVGFPSSRTRCTPTLLRS